MNGTKNNPRSGGARGAGNGLRGGKTKQVVRRTGDLGDEPQESNPSRGTHDKTTVWSRGSYVMIRPPKGPGVAFRRTVGGGRSRVYAGDSITNSAGSVDTTTTLRDVPKDTLNDGDDDFNVDFNDGDNSDDGGDDRELMEHQEKRIMAHNSSRDGRGGGSGRVNVHGRTNNVGETMVRSSIGGGRGRGGGRASEQVNETMIRSSTGGGRGRGGGRASEQVNETMIRSSTGGGRGRGSGRASEQVNEIMAGNSDAYQPLNGHSDDDEDDVQVVGRGSVVLPPIPTPENRNWIWVENDEFNIQNQVSRTIGGILKLMWAGGWQGWKDVPIFHRERMFERFQKYYQWEDEAKHSIYSCWERCIKGKFPNLLGKARKFAKARALQEGIEVGDDWGVTNPFKPQWISQKSWKKLVKIWNTTSWKEKSSQNSKNRNKATGGRHTVGSKSFVTIRKEMDTTLKRHAKFGEFWLQTHAKKGSRPLDKLPVCNDLEDDNLEEAYDMEKNFQEQNVDWVDTRAGEAYESYMQLVVKKYGDDVSLHPEFDMELWSSIAGGKKKRRLYGTSNITDPYIVLTGAPSKSSNDAPSGTSNKQVQLLEDKIAELEREKKEELERGKAEKNAMLEKIEENARLFAEMNEKLQLLLPKV